MTELSMLYGGYGAYEGSDTEKPREDNKISAGQQIHQLASQLSQAPQIAQASQAQLSQQPQQIQEPMQNMAPMPLQPPPSNNYQSSNYQSNNNNYQQAYRKRPYEYTFWDRMSLKRPEVVKLTIFSLVIVFAIAIDRMGTHYISKYISENVLSDMQEFLLRLSYPIIIFLILWIAKSW